MKTAFVKTAFVKTAFAIVASLSLGACGGNGSSGGDGADDLPGDAAIDSATDSNLTDVVAESSLTDATPTDVPAIDAAPPPTKFLDFFPIGVWTQPIKSFSTWKSRGINTLVGAEDEGKTVSVESWSKAAEDVGLHMIRRPLSDPGKDVGDKLLLAWQLPDEPDNKVKDAPASALKAQYDAWKKLDPARTIFLNFSGGNVWFTDGGNAQCNGPGDGTATDDCYPQYLAATDWVSNDFYPIAGWDPPLDLALVGKIIDKLTRWSKGKPQFAFVETCDQQLPWAPAAGGPNASQFREEIWDAIIHGARGIFYFADQLGGGGTRFTWDGTTPEVVAEMQKQNDVITALASVLQGPIDPSPFGVAVAAPLEAAWRSDASGTYFIVLNQSASAVSKASIELKGVGGASSANVFGTTRTAAISAGTIADDFAPYDVHVYVVK